MLSSSLAKTRQLSGLLLKAKYCTAPNIPSYETLAVSVPKPFVFHVELNRPKQLNALNKALWVELGKCFESLSDNPDCRVVVLSGSGKHFTAGLDLNDMMVQAQEVSEHEDIARKCKVMNRMIRLYQESISSLEKCVKPVITCTHGACVGAGVDMITAADIRYATKDAWFQVKEVDIGMAADVGTLQRLPKIIGNMSLVRELCFTARKVHADEALSCGLVGKLFEDRESLLKGALELAEDIASKSPLAIQLTKESLVYAQDHTTQEGLDFIRTQNQVMLQSEDFVNACMAQATKSEKPVFAKL